MMATTHTKTVRHNDEEYMIGNLGVEKAADADVADALTERLDACEHMFVRENATAVTNTYAHDPTKEPKTYIVQTLRLSLGDRTHTVHSCGCRDFRYRKLPSASQAEKDATPEGEVPPDPLDVDPDELWSVLWDLGTCKHIDAALRYESEAARRGGY